LAAISSKVSLASFLAFRRLCTWTAFSSSIKPVANALVGVMEAGAKEVGLVQGERIDLREKARRVPDNMYGGRV